MNPAKPGEPLGSTASGRLVRAGPRHSLVPPSTSGKPTIYRRRVLVGVQGVLKPLGPRKTARAWPVDLSSS